MATPKVKLQVQLLPKSIVRAAIAGEFLRNLGLTDDKQISNVQQGLAEGLLKSVAVVGVTANSTPADRYTLRFNELADDAKIELDTSDGKSHFEALDANMAAMLQWQVGRMRRNGWTPTFIYEFSDYALKNPTYLADAKKRLNFVDVPHLAERSALPPMQVPTPSPPNIPNYYPLPRYTPSVPPTPFNGDWQTALDNIRHTLKAPPPTPPTHTYTKVLEITPAKDKGITFTAEILKRL